MGERDLALQDGATKSQARIVPEQKAQDRLGVHRASAGHWPGRESAASAAARQILPQR
jgi:hypothetical protein